MQILIGCAKDMTSCSEWQVPFTTTPRFQEKAIQGATQMMAYSVDELRDMLKISVPLAKELRQRYSHFLDSETGMAAILSYSGVVYKHLGLENFTTADFEYAQQHLWITSFLYGLLRPLDAIKPYRLEGKIELPENGCSMFAYWKPRLTDIFIQSIKEDDGVLVDLASNEMRSFFDWKRVEREVTVVKPDFFVNKGGMYKNVTVYAKQCRGMMTGGIIKERLTSPEDLLALTPNGFVFQGEDKAKNNLVFVL